jgi:CBS domain containing-hemolysin-like protein
MCWGSRWIGLVSAALTFSVILFSEIIPKTIGERHALPVTLTAVLPTKMLVVLFFPIVWLIEHLLKPFLKDDHRFTTNESEIKTLLSIGSKEGVIEGNESRMIHQVFKLNDIRAVDIMTPRVMMTTLKKKQRLEQAKDKIVASQHSRIVVIEKTHDDVAGIVMKTELLQALLHGEGDRPLSEFIHEALFVPESKHADALLAWFREKRQHLAVVIDEYGGVAGVVTLEDVLEVLTGEIMDETDSAADLQNVARMRVVKMD